MNVTNHNEFFYEVTTDEGYTLGYAKRNPGGHNWHVFTSIPHEKDSGFDWIEIAIIPVGNVMVDKVIRTILGAL